MDVEAVIECVAYDVWDGPCAVQVLMWLGFVVFMEFCFCNLIMCDVNGSVSVCEFF